MSDVPDEVLREILSRLTVTPLLRFRCVCKSWKCLIDSDQFIKDHLNHSRKSNSSLNIIIRSGCLYSADFDDLFTETNPGTFQPFLHPLNTPHLDTEILGSCDGLLVLSNGEEKIILWNPSTRRFQNIPVSKMDFRTEYCFSAKLGVVYGFGYDVVSDDYKLIRIVKYYALLNDKFDVCDPEVKVYSLKSNSWRRISNFPYFLGMRRDIGVLANGALHWVVLSDAHSFGLVAAFDLGTEEYRLVSLPEFEGDKFYMRVRVLGGCLSLVCDCTDHIDIWVMKVYGIQESWSRLFTIDVGCQKNVDFLMPIAYSSCGRKVLLRVESCVMWYDIDKNSADSPMFQIPYGDSFLLHTCLKSLVRLNNSACDLDIVPKNEPEEEEGKHSVTILENGHLFFWLFDSTLLDLDV